MVWKGFKLREKILKILPEHRLGHFPVGFAARPHLKHKGQYTSWSNSLCAFLYSLFSALIFWRWGLRLGLLIWPPSQSSPANIKPDGNYSSADKRRVFWDWSCIVYRAGQAPCRWSCRDTWNWQPSNMSLRNIADRQRSPAEPADTPSVLPSLVPSLWQLCPIRGLPSILFWPMEKSESDYYL